MRAGEQHTVSGAILPSNRFSPLRGVALGREERGRGRGDTTSGQLAYRQSELQFAALAGGVGRRARGQQGGVISMQGRVSGRMCNWRIAGAPHVAGAHHVVLRT